MSEWIAKGLVRIATAGERAQDELEEMSLETAQDILEAQEDLVRATMSRLLENRRARTMIRSLDIAGAPVESFVAQLASELN